MTNEDCTSLNILWVSSIDENFKKSGYGEERNGKHSSLFKLYNT